MSRDKRSHGAQPLPRRGPTAAEIIDRVLDRGIVIDYRSRISVAGIDMLLAVDARYVVTSCDTDLEYARRLQEPKRKSGDIQPRFDDPAPAFYSASNAASARLMRRKKAATARR